MSHGAHLNESCHISVMIDCDMTIYICHGRERERERERNVEFAHMDESSHISDMIAL